MEDINLGNGTRSTIKSKLLKLKEYRCECCGISSWNNKPISLEMHHLDGNTLNNNLSNLQLLCPNCHSQTNNYKRNNNKRKITDDEIAEAIQTSYTLREAAMKLGLSKTSGAFYDRFYKIMYQRKIELLDKKLTKRQEKSGNVVLKSSNKNYKKSHYYCVDCGKEISNGAIRCMDCSLKRRSQLYRKCERPSREELKILIRSTSFLQIGKMFDVSDNAIRKWCKSYNLPYKSKDIKSYTDREWEVI